MWPFPKKEPLSAEKLPIPDTWAVLKGHDLNGKPLIVRIHTGYEKYKGVTGYGHQVAIAIPLVDMDAEGFPTPGETDELTRIENDICQVFEPEGESVFVAATTIPGLREYILYTRDPDSAKIRFENDLLARVFTHQAHIKIQPDKDWNLYGKLL
jgi:hypothetical protein